MRRAADKDRLVEADGDGNDVASVVAAIGSSAAHTGDKWCDFVDIDDAARHHLGRAVTGRIGGNNREAVVGLRCLVIEGNRLGDFTGAGVDAEAGKITCFRQRVGNATADITAIGGFRVIDNGAGGVFGDGSTAGARIKAGRNLIKVGDRQRHILRGAVAGPIGGDDGEEVAGLGLVVRFGGQGDIASGGVDRKQAAIGRVGEGIGDTAAGSSGVHHLSCSGVLADGCGKAAAGGEHRSNRIHRDQDRFRS